MKEQGIGVVIVEDEPRVGMLVQSLITWEEIGLSCLAVLSNAEDAISVIETRKPPIVVTDIRMPTITGLDLIARIQELGMETRFIVISGHKDFEYARKALQFGVANYLLKPINGHELNTNLKNIVNELETESINRQAAEDLRRTIVAGKKLIKRNVFEYIVNNGDRLSLKAVQELYGLNLTEPRFNVIDMKLDYRNLNDIDGDHDCRTVERMLDLVESEFAAVSTETVINSAHSLHFVCLLNYGVQQVPGVQKSIHRILADVENLLLEFERYDITIGMGTEKVQFSDIATCIGEARNAVDRRIQLGPGRLIKYEPYEQDSTFDLSTVLARYRDSLANSMSAFSPDFLQEWIEAIFNDAQLRAQLHPPDYYRLARVMIDDYMREVQDQGAQISGRIKEIRSLINHCNSVKRLKEYLTLAMSEALIALRNIVMSRTNRPIRLAIEYINDNYSDKIRLETMAQMSALNPTYFSVLFKNETGKNFSTYVSDVRIDRAKRKLVETNDTIAAIGASVGYRDVRYFSRLFAKTVGIRPGLFRKLHS